MHEDNFLEVDTKSTLGWVEDYNPVDPLLKREPIRLHVRHAPEWTTKSALLAILGFSLLATIVSTIVAFQVWSAQPFILTK